MVRCPPSISVQELREACDYLLIPFDSDTVKCQNLRKYSELWYISVKKNLKVKNTPSFGHTRNRAEI